ncbi:MAG: elongation factor 1-beta [Nanoarchaeota archaeon]
MATVIIVTKLMPSSPEADLSKIINHASVILNKEGARNVSFEERPIAFGLKAVIIKMDMPEEKGTDTVESLLANIPEVSSVTIEEYRRAFG